MKDANLCNLVLVSRRHRLGRREGGLFLLLAAQAILKSRHVGVEHRRQVEGDELREQEETLALLVSVRRVWRNRVMHPNDSYSFEDAEKIYRATVTFMEHLTTIL